MTAYQYALAITSQFPFCSIPFRLDSYSACQFNCQYCFAGSRGGFTGEQRVQLAEPAALGRRLHFLKSEPPRSVIDELLAARVPLHFGGMSDPFMPLERKARVTLGLLHILHEHRYPTIISTKSTLCGEDPYKTLLATGNFLVQISISTTDDSLGTVVDAGAALPSARFNVLERLSRAGVRTACRVQPILPKYEHHAFLVAELAATAGARHASFEHLKLPIEANAPTVRRLSALLGRNLTEDYRRAGAARMGREWVLPAKDRLDRILELRRAAWRLGLTFGAADNDFLPLSDGNSCCSGADLFGFDTTYRFTFTQAVNAAKRNTIRFSNIAHEWRPTKSIRRFVNSRSRNDSSSIDSYLRTRWNGRNNGPSPTMFYGVDATGKFDREGFSVYRLSKTAARLIQEKHAEPGRVYTSSLDVR